MKIIIGALLLLSLCIDNNAIAAEKKALVISGNDVAPLVSGQRVRVKKLTRDMAGVRKSIVSTGPSAFQNPDVVSAKIKRMNQFSDAIKRYPQVNDQDVKAARAEYEALRQTLSAEFKRAKEQLSTIGDVQQTLATLEKNSTTYAVPAPLGIPFNESKAKEWVNAASNARTVAEHNQKQLAQIAQLAYLPTNRGTPQTGRPYDIEDVRRMQRNAANMLSTIQVNYEQITGELNYRMREMDTDVFARWQEDPKGEKKWLYIQDGSAAEAQAVFAKSRAIAQSSVYFEQALNRKPEFALATLARIDRAEAAFEQKSKIALASSRLPESKSDDKKMLNIAKAILKTSKYRFGEYGPIKLTTEKIIERERKDSQLEIDDAEITLGGDLKWSGTETTWTYKWEEFKFAVPLKETGGEKWYIWWITAKNFSSGGPNTPIGSWISGKATKGNPIPRENF
jgi:hypothetical protein